MGGYHVRLISTRGLKQRWHVRIESAANGETLLWSEKYRDRDHALQLARTFAELLGAGTVIT
jgi:hypothetical protein